MAEKEMGRPVERGAIKRVTLEIPADLWEYITSVSSNRTRWIVQVLQDKRRQGQAPSLERKGL